MKTTSYKIPWPVRLNTIDDPLELYPDECVENINLVRNDDGSIGARELFSAVLVSGSDILLSGAFLATQDATEKIFIYGHDSNGGFIGYLNIGDTTLTKLITHRSLWTIPTFVNYKDTIYFLGIKTSSNKILKYKYKTDEITGTGMKYGKLGVNFMERLWISGFPVVDIDNHYAPGILRYTDTGDEGYGEDNWMEIGNIREPVTGLFVGIPNQIVIGKLNETWRLAVGPNGIENGDVKLEQISKRSGVYAHYSGVSHFDTLLYHNHKSVWMIDPRKIIVNVERIVEADPGIYEVGEKVKNLVGSYFGLLPDRIKSIFKRYSNWFTTEDGNWSIDDIDWSRSYNVEMHDTDKGIYLPISGTELNYEGVAILQPIKLPPTFVGDYVFTHIKATGYLDILFASKIELFFGLTPNGPWTNIPKFKDERLEPYQVRTWDCDIYYITRESDTIYLKIKFDAHELAGYQPTPPYFTDVDILAEVATINRGSGYHDNIYYLFGIENNQNLGYKHGGWLKIQDSIRFYSVVDKMRWTTTNDIIGFGKQNGSGVLILQPKTRTHGSMTIQGKTGKNDFGSPEIPKNLRGCWITYKCTNNVTLNITDDNGDTHTKTLPAQSDFALRKFHFDTDRSKWFDFEVITNYSDFSFKQFRVLIREHYPNEI